MAWTVLRRLQTQRGFTLLELLIVIVVIAILAAIAVPAYLKFKARADETAAQANIRAMIPAVEAYRLDNSASGFAGMTIGGAAGLAAVYDPALKGWDAAAASGVTILSAGATTYCIKSTESGITYYKNGPLGEIVQAPACS